MYFALDKENNRVFAEDGIFTDCVCEACGMPVIQKRGDYRRHHFAHKKKVSTCPFECNSDYINESEWHKRMKEYFPKEQREHIFFDKATGEKHIADIYIEPENTVLEFQHSPIKREEFLSRTQFHLNEGRKIAWLFDESWKNKDEELGSKDYTFGKLQKKKDREIRGPYSNNRYKWLYRRKCVEELPDICKDNYSILVYTGTEGDTFHRIIFLDKECIIISIHNVTMTYLLDSKELFYSEEFWQEQEPWKSKYSFLPDVYRNPPFKDDKLVEYAGSLQSNKSINNTVYIPIKIDYGGREADKKFLAEAQEKVRKYQEDKISESHNKRQLDEEDRMRTLVDYFDHIDRKYKEKK